MMVYARLGGIMTKYINQSVTQATFSIKTERTNTKSILKHHICIIQSHL